MTLFLFNHPVLLAAAAVIALGVVVYEIVSSHEGPYRMGGNGRPPRPPSPPRPPPPSSTDKSNKTCDSTVSPSQSSHGNILRKRNLNQTASTERSSPDLKNELRVTPAADLEEQSQTSSIESRQDSSTDEKFDDNNYSLNVLSKLINDTKDIDENFGNEKKLSHNIYEEDEDSSENNLPSKSDKKINKTISNENAHGSNKTNKRRCLRKSKNTVKKSVENHTDNKHSEIYNQSQTELSSDSNSDLFNCILAQRNKKKYTSKCYSRQHASKNVSDQSSKSDSSSKHLEIDVDPLLNSKPEPYKKSVSPDARHTSRKNVWYASKNSTNQNSKPQSSRMYPDISFDPSSNLKSELYTKNSSSDARRTFRKTVWYASKNSKHQPSGMYPEISFDPLLNLKSEFENTNSSSDEDNYKEKVREALQRDLNDQEINGDPDSSSVCSPEKNEEESLTESNICKACEEKHINTRACPCNHSFLCADCAVRIFRLYKKCSICLEDVVEFEQFAL